MGGAVGIEGLTAHQVRLRAVGGWATGRYGVVTRRKLLAAGFSVDEVRWLVGAGWLQRRHAGVYVVGHGAFVAGQREAVALAASGASAALARSTAGAWRGLVERPAGPVQLIVPRGRDGALPGVRRSLAALPDEDVEVVRGLRCTTVERTLLDLPARYLPQAMVAALRRGIDLEPLEARVRGRPGAPAFRRELHRLFPDLAHTMSELEVRFLRLLRRHGLAIPRVNEQHGRRVLDCRWPGSSLVVELDGRRWHEHRFQQDVERTNELVLDGLRVIRFTWWDVVERPDHVVAQVRRALAA